MWFLLMWRSMECESSGMLLFIFFFFSIFLRVVLFVNRGYIAHYVRYCCPHFFRCAAMRKNTLLLWIENIKSILFVKLYMVRLSSMNVDKYSESVTCSSWTNFQIMTYHSRHQYNYYSQESCLTNFLLS